jgi:hypothetical protein
VQGRISPTEALHILMDGGLSGYHAAVRLDQAVKTNDCKLWHDGELMAPDYFARLLVIVACREADDGWQADVRGNPVRIMVPGKRWVFEFDADEVKVLLPRVNPSEPHADEVLPPARAKPGTKPTDDWPKELAAELIRIAVDDRTALRNIDKLVRKIQKDFDNTNRFLPQDPKRVRAEIVLLLKHVR